MRWDPAWRRADIWDYIATGASAATAFGALAIPPVEDRWTRVNAFDNEARHGLRASSLQGRNRARDVSDLTLMLSINQVLLDTLVVTWWGHDAGTVAFEMAVMNIEALAISSAINGLVVGITSRERPYGDMCVGELDRNLQDCRSTRRYRSFYSGHASTTFTIAGLTCMHHAYLPLYGGGAPDIVVCGASFAIAAATGTLRIVGDQHFASDVLTGAAVGTLTGLAVPWLLHYRTGDPTEADAGGDFSIKIIPAPTGVQVIAAF